MAITEQWLFLTGMNHGKEILPLLRLLEVGGGMTVTEFGMLMCTMEGRSGKPLDARLANGTTDGAVLKTMFFSYLSPPPPLLRQS